MEVGSHSPWISRFFQGLGHEVLVANPRKMRAIFKNDRMCDLYDARMLAKIARFDRSMLIPSSTRASRRSATYYKSRSAIAWCAAVWTSFDARRLTARPPPGHVAFARVHPAPRYCTVRCAPKSLGVALKSPHTEYFARYARRDLAGEHAAILVLVEPALATLDTVCEQIKVLDDEIAKLAAARYPQVELLTGIAGVGVLTALCFVLVVGDHERFAKPRDIGGYLGLVPKRDQSGEVDKELRISRKGDAYLRRLLVGSAQYILGPFGPECDMRARGLALAGRGGKLAKKKAVVATARKLAVVMLPCLKTYLPNVTESPQCEEHDQISRTKITDPGWLPH